MPKGDPPRTGPASHEAPVNRKQSTGSELDVCIVALREIIQHLNEQSDRSWVSSPNLTRLNTFLPDLQRRLIAIAADFPPSKATLDAVKELQLLTTDPIAQRLRWKETCADLDSILELLRQLQAKLPRPPSARKTPKTRKRNDELEALRRDVKQMHQAGLSQQEMVNRLGGRPRPPNATWRDDAWPQAYLKYNTAVKKWLSSACRDP